MIQEGDWLLSVRYHRGPGPGRAIGADWIAMGQAVICGKQIVPPLSIEELSYLLSVDFSAHRSICLVPFNPVSCYASNILVSEGILDPEGVPKTASVVFASLPDVN